MEKAFAFISVPSCIKIVKKLVAVYAIDIDGSIIYIYSFRIKSKKVEMLRGFYGEITFVVN